MKIENRVNIKTGGKRGKDEYFEYDFFMPKTFQDKSESEIKDNLQEMCKIIHTKNQLFEINHTIADYSVADPKDIPKSKFNTIIRVNIPYVIYFPNFFSITVKEPRIAKITFFKHWTDKIENPNKFDVVSSETLYYGDNKYKTPIFPIENNKEWQFIGTGKNIEKINDNTGYFRFTSLKIEFNTKYHNKTLKNNPKAIIQKITDDLIRLINHFLTIYRKISGRVHIKPLKEVMITDLFFLKKNIGFHFVNMDITKAKINHSRKIIKKCKVKIEKGYSVGISDILFDNAKANILSKEFKLAVVESFQGFDVFIEKAIIDLCKKMKLPKKQFAKLISGTTKTRLNNIKTLIAGSKFNSVLHDKWKDAYDDIRIPIIHKDKDPKIQEAKRVIRLNDKMVKMISRSI